MLSRKTFATNKFIEIIFFVGCITAARIMSTTLKIGNRGGLLVSQLEKKFKLLFSCRNI